MAASSKTLSNTGTQVTILLSSSPKTDVDAADNNLSYLSNYEKKAKKKINPIILAF